MNLDDLIGGGGNIHLKLASLVEGTVQQSQETLMSDIGPVLGRISFEFVGDVIGMVFTIEENVLFFNVGDLESGFFQDHDNFSFVDFVFLCEVDDFCWS
jgi:hypothetical protein